MEKLLREIRSCSVCKKILPNKPRPIVQAGIHSKVVIIGHPEVDFSLLAPGDPAPARFDVFAWQTQLNGKDIHRSERQYSQCCVLLTRFAARIRPANALQHLIAIILTTPFYLSSLLHPAPPPPYSSRSLCQTLCMAQNKRPRAFTHGGSCTHTFRRTAPKRLRDSNV